jgi:peptidyl-Lys metalloendopeptidase
MPDDDQHQWVQVATGTTNTTPNSNVDVFLSLDGPPICPNMSDAAFRRNLLKLRDKAVMLVDKRLDELAHWSPEAKTRVSDWFGRSDDATRDHLMFRFPALKNVLRGLEPKSFPRA